MTFSTNEINIHLLVYTMHGVQEALDFIIKKKKKKKRAKNIDVMNADANPNKH